MIAAVWRSSIGDVVVAGTAGVPGRGAILATVLQVEIGTGLAYHPCMTAPCPFGDGDFAHIVRHAPFVSIDVMVRRLIELDSQHSSVRSMSKDDILSADNVHPNTKAFFL
jgi:hypothetical protein